MKRLTRLETLTSGLNSMPIVKVENQIQANQKLFIIEDIEEELGIYLFILFRALKNGIYTNVFYGGTNKAIVRGIEKNGIVVISPVFPYPECDKILLYSEYGKTWALTKEELLPKTLPNDTENKR